jgi:G3E family GTPase
MRMKADIEIVTGFIGSGKTTFINALIQDTIVDNEKIVIIQCETGETKIEVKLQNHRAVIVKSCDEEKPFTEEYIKYILDLYRPHRLIIEFNGMEIINELLDSLHKRDLKKRCKLTTMFHISDVATFDLYLNNMSSMLLPPIQLSNLILLNNTDSIRKEKLEDIQFKIENLNSHAYIIEAKNTGLLKSTIKQANVLDKGFLKKCRIYMKNSLYK